MSVDRKEEESESDSIGDYHIRYLAGKLNVSYEDIENAIRQVGKDEAIITEYIKQRKATN